MGEETISWTCPGGLVFHLPEEEPSGSFTILVDPQSVKTKYSHDTTVGNRGDVGKILNKKVQNLYEDYLSRHRPVIMESLGVKAMYDRTFTDEKDGEG